MARGSTALPCCPANCHCGGGASEPKANHLRRRYLPGAPVFVRERLPTLSAAAACLRPAAGVWPPVHGWTNAGTPPLNPSSASGCARFFPNGVSRLATVTPHSSVARPEVTESTHVNAARSASLLAAAQRSTLAAELGRSYCTRSSGQSSRTALVQQRHVKISICFWRGSYHVISIEALLFP